MKRIFFVVFVLLIPFAISGQDSFYNLVRAKALIAGGNADQAVEILSSAISSGKSQHLLTGRAEALMAKGKFQEAIADLNEANSILRNSGEYGLAQAYAMKGDAATSLYHLELNLKSSFRKSEKEIMLDPAFSRIENRPEWRSFWKKGWYSDLEEAASEVEYYVSTGKPAEAQSVYSQVLTSYADRKEVIYAGALVSLSLQKYPEAIKTLTGLLSDDPDNEKYLRSLANAQTLASNFAGASVTYSRLIDLEVPDAGLLMKRAECYRKTGETDNALSDIGIYLSLYPGDKAALSMAGRLESAAGNNLKAIGYFNENLRLHPQDPECYIDRGNTYMASKSWDFAVNDYGMSLDLNPGNSDVWLSKGIALLGSGKTADACHDFRMSLSLGNKRATDYISRYCIK